MTSHFTLDKANAATREMLAGKADFLGAIRLPSDAFKQEGTRVVTDIVFLKKRAPGEAANHADPDWLATGPLAIDGVELPVNRYFLNHPEQVLGAWSRQDRLYDATYSVLSNGDLAEQLQAAIERFPQSPRSSRGLVDDSTGPRHAAGVTFNPPPLEKHIAEGSFFIGDGKVIHQFEAGQGVPVVYGGITLKSDGTMTGRRLAGLIGLRDTARQVLRSQNEGWPEIFRQDARRALNRAYDRFAAAYGPINKTSFSEAKDGTVIRRMPNVVKFREDPDAMLVFALEDYDEVTGKAGKAPILLKDVVGKTPPITRRHLGRGGITGVARPHRRHRPALYLETLRQARGRHHRRALRSHLPRPGQPGLADRRRIPVRQRAGQAGRGRGSGAGLRQERRSLTSGAARGRPARRHRRRPRRPWIPASDVKAFAAELFGVAADAMTIGHLKKDAVWSVEAGHAAQASVAATAEYGTARANGTWLFEQALNLKTPVIYDTINHGDREERVVNQEATLAAREKQSAIKAKFKSWVFAESARADRLVRLYNDTYNNLRPRLFDGGHLDFPGMSQGIRLNPHQADAVWRGMSSGNTLLAHAVGAGKTFTMAATGMKMKQAGLLKKPVYAVPNHMLEQFAREFMQLYPNARLLVATKDDLARDRRKLLTAKIAGGEWDGIIVTHSSFERMGMSKDYQERFLREQIAEYDSLLRDAAGGKSPRNLIKTIEKQKARRQERLKELAALDKKDDGLVFDELGVDHVFIDEAHFFKNLETPTKMERVAGIQTGGSERAFDLYMKARYLGEKHPGHGVTFATGTPISNTMVEMFTVQRFLDPEGLKSRGIEHFDGWAATFGEVVDTMEISPDGASSRPRSRFAKFTNLPELQQMFRAFADVQTADMLELPRPALVGGKAQIVACPMSGEQAGLQAELVARYERLRKEKVDPREDNALAITTDGRKLALDARLLAAAAEDFPESKVNALAENVARIWAKTAATRGTQMIFCDMGVNPTPWGYCVYDEIIGKLTARGIPAEQIAAVGDADSDAKKQSLFDRVRSGAVRVLIGSTAKMGTGTNVQKRLVALHHLDAPWKPAEVEQREGRILRQGNENQEAAIYRYVTEGSFDAYMWQALETKAKFIGQVMTGESAARRAEDIGGSELSYAEVKAIASGNPAVLTLAEADAELQRLLILKKNHADEQYLARRSIRDLPGTIARLTKRAADLTADQATLAAHARDPLTLGGHRLCRGGRVKALARQLNSIPDKTHETRRYPLGVYHGLRFGIVVGPLGAPDAYLEGATTRHGQLSRDAGPRAVLNALGRLADTYPNQLAATAQDLAIAEGQLRDYQARLGQPFAHDEYLSELTDLRDRLKAGLSQATPETPATSAGQAHTPPVAELAGRIKSLKAAHAIDAAPERTATRRIAAEEPVTARIRRKPAELRST